MFAMLLAIGIQSMLFGPAVGLPAQGDPSVPELTPAAVSQTPRGEVRPAAAGQEPPAPVRSGGRGRGGTPPAAEASGQSTAPAPQAGGGPPPIRRSVPFNPTIIRLQHADSFGLVCLLNDLRTNSEIVIAEDSRTNTVIVSGTDDDKARVEALIRELDVPASTEHGSSVVTVNVEHRGAEELARQLQMVLGGREHNLRIAADENRAMLLLKGAGVDVNAAVELVKRLDTPSTSVNLEFSFFHADANSKEPDADIPADLASVAKELKRFGRLEVLGRLSTTGLEHEEFAVEGRVLNTLHARVQGELDKAAPGGAVRLQLRAVLSMQAAPSPKPEGEGKSTGGIPSFDLGTVVLTKPGDYVVLGSAPTGWAPGESAILVLHVRP